MNDELNKLLEQSRSQMDKAIEHLNHELTKIRAGKASPQMLDSVVVEAYGVATPLAGVGSINTPDARTIVIQPWDKSLLKAIEQGITYANLGFNPQNDGTVVRISVPPLTEERRKQLVKQAHQEAEVGKVSIRNIRKDTNEHIMRLLKNGLPEDEGKAAVH